MRALLGRFFAHCIAVSQNPRGAPEAEVRRIVPWLMTPAELEDLVAGRAVFLDDRNSIAVPGRRS